MTMKSKIAKYFVAGAMACSTLVYSGCTNLDEDVFSQIVPETFFQNDAQALSTLIPIYAQLRSYLWNYYNISQHTSDETMVPQRGGDWGDGGVWAQLHTHTWDKTHPQINGAWIDAYTGVARANVFIDNLSRSSVNDNLKKAFNAEARFLRAYFYFQLMDFFGGVPIVTTPTVDAANPPARSSRQEVFNFIESELRAAVADLPATATGPNFGRATKGAANTLLAKMYLNAQVYTGTPRWQDCINACDAVINSNVYRLANNYFDNFVVNNENSPEAIFVIGNVNQSGLGLTFTMRNFHYNQLPQSPWNGFCTIAEFIDQFSEPGDVRRNILQEGRAINFLTGQPAFDRSGNPLIFTRDVPLVNASEGAGVRVLKWQVDPAQNGGDAGNDYFIFRYADVLLMKAEALNELNGPTAEAVNLVNQVRNRSISPPRPLSAASFNRDTFRAQILRERSTELGWEATRRTDLIRHNRFTAAWTNKPASQAIRNLFPIPQAQIDANPKLTQNPGY